jgi:hypothetical protein
VVSDELHQTQPTGLRCATFRLDDGRTLARVAVDETLHQRNPLLEVAAFRRFTDGIASRCEIPRTPPRRTRSAATAYSATEPLAPISTQEVGATLP